MEQAYTFRKIEAHEIPQMFQMILQRMKWMDEKGIRQWNVTKYDEVYPQSYYEEKAKKGEVFVLEENETREIVCAAVLKSEDARWNDTEPSLYLRNFVSKIGKSGVGAVFMRFAEAYAIEQGKTYFRLDSADDNEPLAAYYETKGFLPVGRCVDGMYTGILRQKKLRQHRTNS